MLEGSLAILISSYLGVVYAFGDAFGVSCCAPDLLNALLIFVEAGVFVVVDTGYLVALEAVAPGYPVAVAVDFTGFVGAYLNAR